MCWICLQFIPTIKALNELYGLTTSGHRLISQLVLDGWAAVVLGTFLLYQRMVLVLGKVFA